LLLAGGLIAGCALIEIAVRLYTGFPLLAPGGPEDSRYVNIDPVIGRIPKPGLSLRMPDGFSMHTGDHGVRLNGGVAPSADRPPILAVGDSFAFGDDVNDEESWPAFLERLSGRWVINAGVPGFGLDQAVLRAEQLVEVYKPDTVVVGIIPHDVDRCAMSYWSGHPKPYFELESAGLRLHPAPVPPRPAYEPLRWLLSRSVAMDLLFPRFLHWQGPEELVVHGRARDVACALMERLAVLGRAHHTRIVILAHPQVPEVVPEHAESVRAVLACAAANGLGTLDLFPVFARLPAERAARLFAGHLTAAGNRLVATELAGLLAGENGAGGRNGTAASTSAGQ
jgi:hypothetical protein